MPGQAPDDRGEVPVLVVVLRDPADLARARDERWYRIPLARAPRRIAAEYLAFYQTGGFPPGERWAVRWLAPVRGYYITTRRDLIPGQPDHARACELYYKIILGPLAPLARPVPSARLRRITFIATTLDRLAEAEEINDLWIKSTAQERLWAALRQAGIAAERQYPLEPDEASAGGGASADESEDDDWPRPRFVADFALPGSAGGAALLISDEPGEEGALREAPPPDYELARGGWRALSATQAMVLADPAGWAARLAALAREMSAEGGERGG